LPHFNQSLKLIKEYIKIHKPTALKAKSETPKKLKSNAFYFYFIKNILLYFRYQLQKGKSTNLTSAKKSNKKSIVVANNDSEDILHHVFLSFEKKIIQTKQVN